MLQNKVLDLKNKTNQLINLFWHGRSMKTINIIIIMLRKG